MSAGARSPGAKTPGPTPGTRVLKLDPAPKSTDVASVAISSDGRTVVVGQPADYQDRTQTASAPGSAYVFARASRSSRWQQKAVLTAPPGNVAGDGFGQAVAVSANGDEIAVGSPGASVGGHPNAGAVYVFARGAGWSGRAPVAALTPSDPADGTGVGDAVGISGSVVVAGTGHGHPVYLFVRRAAAWASETQQAELSAPPAPGGCSALNDFGSAVALDGRTVAVGYSAYPSARSCKPDGAVFMFERPSGGWANTDAPTATLRAKRAGTGGFVGASLALQGGTMAAGAPNTVVGGDPDVGAVYVFEKPKSGWRNATETARLVPSVVFADDLFGGTVGISGNTIVASNSFCPNGPVNCPFVFKRSAGHWGADIRELVAPVSSRPAGGAQPVAAGGGTAIEVSETRGLPVVVFRLSSAGRT